MKKLLLLIMVLLSSNSFANVQYGDWIKNDSLEAFMSKDLVNGEISALLKPRKTGDLTFGFFINDESCLFLEAASEPYNSLLVVGEYSEFKYQCIGKNQAVIFPSSDYVSNRIVDVLINHGNVCIKENRDKYCFSGKGVSQIKSNIKQ